MPNYFLINSNGQKKGPYNEEQLQELAASGFINPQTPLETDSGHKGRAGQIRSLQFSDAPHGGQTVLNDVLSSESTKTAGEFLWNTLDFSFKRFYFLEFFVLLFKIFYVIGLAFCLLVMVSSPVVAILAGFEFGLFLLCFFGGLLGIPLVRWQCEGAIFLVTWFLATKKAADSVVEAHSNQASS